MKFMEPTTLAYIAGFLDGDGSIFFQIIREKEKFRIRSSIAFYQKSNNSEILDWLKCQFGVGYIRHRKTGISDYTVVDSKEVFKILKLLQPYVRLKKKHVELGLEILQKMQNKDNFGEIYRLVDKFKDINYSKKRTITYETVSKFLPL
ncbi:MAG: hypothetical protein KKB21_01880 [Nanoarchaeota archaeon]|nr:hypothetical protein [Nanoarchaeota archaeon]MBU4086305.1 hypothetical protein [Nanoarchaeota archaeon]